MKVSTKTFTTTSKMDPDKMLKLAVIWGKTHRDFRSKLNGKKSILVLREGGTTLVPLEDLTDTEIAQKMPKNVMIVRA
jgi:hypothetical protein